MSKPDNGAPAFPITAGYEVFALGLTKREYFAGQIMAAAVGGIFADPSSEFIQDDLAEIAVAAAERLLVALGEGG